CRVGFYGEGFELERLEWAINATWNRGESLRDWRKFQTNLAVFCGLAYEPLVSDLRSGKSELAFLNTAKRLLKSFRPIILKAVNRENIWTLDVSVPRGVLWDEKRQQFSPATGGASFEHLAIDNLRRLICKHGHRIMACNAPEARQDFKCCKWFLARRQDQQFCSDRCSSRVTSRRN